MHDIQVNGIEKATAKHYNAKRVDEKMTNDFLLKLNGKINFIGQVRGKEDLIYKRLRAGMRNFN